MDPAGLLHSLDAEQRQAVTSTAQPLAIVAAAGSGKTTVLTRRIAYRVASGTADAKHVLALTFTREAAAELRRRIRRLDLREPIEAGTFHAVALRLLRDRALARNQAAPVVAFDKLRLIRDTLADLRVQLDPRGVIADLDWARARRVRPEHFARANQAARRRAAIPAERYAAVLDAYTARKRRRGVVDFDDLLEAMLVAMRDPTFAEVVRWRFRHFFVDEAQDLNPLQHAVLESWRGGRADICLVGDPRQAIYGWNGSDPLLLGNVDEHYPGVTVVALRSNYRCSPQVVRAGAAVLDEVGVIDDSVSHCADGPAVTVTTCSDEADEAQSAAAVVGRAVSNGSAAEVAVLARTNEQLSLIDQALAGRGVPTTRGAKRSPFDIALATAHRCTSRAELTEFASANAEHADTTVRRVALEVDRFLAAADGGTFRNWVEARQPFDDIEPDDRAAVTVTTFHGAKGREWDTVVIVGANDGLAPHNSATTPERRLEEARLFYVAVTRARRNLAILSTEQRNQVAAVESPWLAPVRRSAAVDKPVVSPLPRRPRPADPLAPWRAWRRQIALGAQIDESAVCSDDTLRALHDHPPADVAGLASALGITPAAAGRLPLLPRATAPGDVADAWR